MIRYAMQRKWKSIKRSAKMLTLKSLQERSDLRVLEQAMARKRPRKTPNRKIKTRMMQKVKHQQKKLKKN